MNNSEKANRKIIKCDECGSYYYQGSSKMAALCPECSHFLYGYEPCEHNFIDGRCEKCYWDASVTNYIKRIKR